MTSYKCTTCFKIFNRKNDYDRHNLRKFKCKPNILNENVTINLNNDVEFNNIHVHQISTEIHRNPPNGRKHPPKLHQNPPNGRKHPPNGRNHITK